MVEKVNEARRRRGNRAAARERAGGARSPGKNSAREKEKNGRGDARGGYPPGGSGLWFLMA